jgi:predicted heme/steroid binding protein
MLIKEQLSKNNIRMTQQRPYLESTFLCVIFYIMLEISLKDLKQYNGKNGNKAYIAYKESIYDVTDSSLWDEGEHQASHYTGEDLTEEIDSAPHGIEVLEGFPVVGHLNKH